MMWSLLSAVATAAPLLAVDAVVADWVVVGGAAPALPPHPSGLDPARAWVVVHGEGLDDSVLDELFVNGRRVAGTSVGGSAVRVGELAPIAHGLDYAGPVGWSHRAATVSGLSFLVAYAPGPAHDALHLWLPDPDRSAPCGAGSVDLGPLPLLARDEAQVGVAVFGSSVGGSLLLGEDTVAAPPASELAVATTARVSGQPAQLAGFLDDPASALSWEGLDCGWIDWAVRLAPLDHDGDGLLDTDDDCTEVDEDGDGHFAAGFDRTGCSAPSSADCDDLDPAVHPGATDLPGDGVDGDCDGDDHCDEDGDLVPAEACGGLDCDDADASVRPFALDTAGDGVDSDCDGDDACDEDGDGHLSTNCGGDDCSDSDPLVHPGALDAPGDGRDKDCDGDDSCDEDGDGRIAIACGGIDCDDQNASVGAGEPEIWYDGVDQDCDGNDRDQDGDGFSAEVVGGRDCDDRDPFVNPGVPDFRGDGVDQNCDGIDGSVAGGDTEGCGGCSGGVPLNGAWPLLMLGLVARRRQPSASRGANPATTGR